MSLKTNQKGFTIVELLIVIVVIAILAAISIVAYTGIQDRARNSTAQNLAAQVAKKAEVAYSLNSSYPTAVAGFTGEAALEGLKVTIANTGPVAASYPVLATNFSSLQAALDQFTSGTRVIYVGGASGYAVYYRTSSTAMTTITKGTVPAGSYTFSSNENP